MIQSFKCKDTQALFSGESPRRFRAIQEVAERKLSQLAAAQTLEFLRSPPGNRLEALKWDRAGQYSIRVNDRSSRQASGLSTWFERTGRYGLLFFASYSL